MAESLFITADLFHSSPQSDWSMSLFCWLSALLCWPGENFPFSITWEDIHICSLMLCFTASSKTWLIFLYSPLKHNSLNFKLKYIVLETKINLQMFQYGVHQTPTPSSPSMWPWLPLQPSLSHFLSCVSCSRRKRELLAIPCGDYAVTPPPCVCPSCVLCRKCSELLNEPCYLFFILDILLKTRLIIPHLCSLYPPLSLHLSSLIVTTCYVSIFSHHLPRNVGSRNVGTGLSHVYPQ